MGCANGSTADTLYELTDCPICYDLFDSIHTVKAWLKCGHLICQKCKARLESEPVFKCPFDRKVFRCQKVNPDAYRITIHILPLQRAVHPQVSISRAAGDRDDRIRRLGHSVTRTKDLLAEIRQSILNAQVKRKQQFYAPVSGYKAKQRASGCTLRRLSGYIY